MRETQIKNERGGSWARVLVFAAAFTLCAFALAFAVFYRTVDALIAQPLEAIVDWIGRIEVEDHGGDYRITLPPTEDAAR
ncbi:hypothetical protein [Paracoccus sp. TOH]|uniref:hypothetical protein n=1 Tax=Paracoccus sp. TOH TaxID=1263728 RepID=UPI0025AFA0A6|nr:hypothetical protein [Paracoccus sp. TOH]WJS84239.1 hypothetical protein NBE95_00150 [Paracoccus sp. TOH]